MIWNDFGSSDDTYDVQKVWKLSYPTFMRSLSDLEWHFYYPWWDEFTLCPIQVIDEPQRFKFHWERIQSANIQYPIDLMYNGAKKEYVRLLILDGMHRLVKWSLLGSCYVPVRVISRKEIPNIR